MNNYVNSSFIPPERPSEHSLKVDAQKKASVQKVDKNNFQNILHSNQKSLHTKSKAVFNERKLEQQKGVQNDGIDFALQKLSVDFEKQLLGIMWNMAFQTSRQFEGGLGEEVFHQELVNEMVKLSKTGEMGDIAKRIYEDLKRKQSNSIYDQ